MSLHFLGSFLLEQGVADQGQIDQAAAFQAESNRRLGALAAEGGLLEPGQVEELLALQRGTDLSFGELAVAKGYVTRRDLNDLLFRQQVHQCHLGEALLTLGHISREQFSRCLGEYAAREQARLEGLDALYRATDNPKGAAGLVAAMERAFLRFARCPLKAQGALNPAELSLYPHACRSAAALPNGRMLPFTLRLSREMFALLERAAESEGPNDPAVADLLRLICQYPGKRVEAEDGQPVPPADFPDGAEAGLCLKLACPQAGVALCLARATASEGKEVIL